VSAAPDTTIVFVRHGNVHNPENLIYGRLPRMRLSSRGRDDVERTAQYLADVPLAAVYTSPLLRARQTAEVIASYHPGTPLRRASGLVEVHSSWEGHSNKVVQETQGFSFYDPPKGEGDETIDDVFTRMDRVVRTVRRRHPGRTTVCVSHGDPIKILRIGYSGKELTPANVRAPDPGQASLVTFVFWHAHTLPIISAIDLGMLERLADGEHIRAFEARRKHEREEAERKAREAAENAVVV
jgi:probable phosphoglycerate mutase